MKHLKLFLLLLAGSLFILSCSQKSEEPWKEIFNGENLNGWTKKNGNAEYFVENEAIVGETVLNSPNTFLCTEKFYADFIVEFEFKLDGDLNSGVQFRSNSYPEYNNNRVHGYQMEIDPSDRKWTGGIFDEARRGWLHPLKGNEKAQNAYNHLQWNKARIEAIGDTIKVWINDIPTSHLVDDMTQKGFFGLQVHGIDNREDKEKLKGTTVRWRNIRIITENPEEYARETTLPAKDNYNKLTDTEEKHGWKLLWDGKTTEGWTSGDKEHFPEKGWKIHNGMLSVEESGGGESDFGGDIITKETYSDFILRVDFKITPGANSGIKYFVQPALNKGQGSNIGLEYQILDDERHPDAQKGNHPGSRTLASLYDLIKAENKYPRPIGEWNHARIVSDGQHVEHWLNGRRVLQYERGSDEFKKIVSESKYAKWENFGLWEEGHILLQDHGNRVSFRNIKIQPLDE